ncbi:hypothetical protein AiwAL_14125 [Acidiphilium sp. AL]|uniref:hypothetical protein n=1 Tax=Acidiphilium sp. AL TaxID=2871704 RepID=UPI0021CB22B2|nr:hypothetical protein [Acidiphilium sp. AL]MCU4161229.1 hypothetical protein [Acidiphilium sp. AL]
MMLIGIFLAGGLGSGIGYAAAQKTAPVKYHYKLIMDNAPRLCPKVAAVYDRLLVKVQEGRLPVNRFADWSRLTTFEVTHPDAFKVAGLTQPPFIGTSNLGDLYRVTLYRNHESRIVAVQARNAGRAETTSTVDYTLHRHAAMRMVPGKRVGGPFWRVFQGRNYNPKTGPTYPVYTYGAHRFRHPAVSQDKNHDCNASVMGLLVSSPPSDHLVAGIMLLL